MLAGYRIIQFIIHLLLGSFLFITALLSPWSLDSLVNTLLTIVMPLVLAALPMASVLLNFKLIRKSSIHCTIQKGFHWPAIALAVACIIIYFTEGKESSYDGHLGFYTVTMKFPDWIWLPEDVERFDISIASLPEGILTALFALLLMYLFLSLKIIRFESKTKEPIRLGKVLILCQMVFGVVVLLIGALCMYGSARNTYSFYTTLKEYNDVLNTYNVSALISRLLGCILFIVYGQWILRDGIKLWKLRYLSSIPV